MSTISCRALLLVFSYSYELQWLLCVCPELDALPYTSTTLANLEIMTTEVFDNFLSHSKQKLSPKMLVSTCKEVHLSHMLHRPPGTNPHKWFKHDDGEVTEAKMDNNEVCMCVISLVCETMSMHNHSCYCEQPCTGTVCNRYTNKMKFCTAHHTCNPTSLVSVYHQYSFVICSNSLFSVGK